MLVLENINYYNFNHSCCLFIQNKKLTATRIVLQEEFVEGNPTTSYTNHYGGSQNSHQSQFLTVTKLNKKNIVFSVLKGLVIFVNKILKLFVVYPVFSFANLENSELLSASTEHDQTFDLIMNLIGIVISSSFFPVGS